MNQREREQKERILAKRPLCEVCNHNRATELHHCLVHDSKRYHALVTVPENLMPVCPTCHTGLAATGFDMAKKQEFVRRQLEHGLDVGAWYRGLPLKVKESWLTNLSGRV